MLSGTASDHLRDRVVVSDLEGEEVTVYYTQDECRVEITKNFADNVFEIEAAYGDKRLHTIAERKTEIAPAVDELIRELKGGD